MKIIKYFLVTYIALFTLNPQLYCAAETDFENLFTTENTQKKKSEEKSEKSFFEKVKKFFKEKKEVVIGGIGATALTLYTIYKLMTQDQKPSKNKPVIIYSDGYIPDPINFPDLHLNSPLCTKRPQKTADYLTNTLKLYTQNELIRPTTPITDTYLAQILEPKYFQSLKDYQTVLNLSETFRKNSFGVYKITEKDSKISHKVSPDEQSKTALEILRIQKLQTAGTILGVKHALENGLAINLGGGFHHAARDYGHGFCLIPDAFAATEKVKELLGKDTKILIIDLDVHRGNGNADIYAEDNNVYIFDVYGSPLFPENFTDLTKDTTSQKAIDINKKTNYNYPMPLFTEDKEYFEKYLNKLEIAIEESNPKFIIYNAGTDIRKGDKNGKLAISDQGIIQRDHLVMKLAHERSIPVLWILSGGYTDDVNKVIGNSIKNIIDTFYK